MVTRTLPLSLAWGFEKEVFSYLKIFFCQIGPEFVRTYEIFYKMHVDG